MNNGFKLQVIYSYYNVIIRNFMIADSFTQVVWKSTQTIGVGILIINRIVNVVVIYSPAGNQPGQYISNVNCVQETELQDRQPNDV